jgi:hypothetical protein
MKPLLTLLTALFVLGTLGAAYQLTDSQRLSNLEQFATSQTSYNATIDSRVHSLEVVLADPTQESPSPTPTPQPNAAIAHNPNAVNVRIRAGAGLTHAQVGQVAPGADVLVCVNGLQNVSGLTWAEVVNGGWVATDYLAVGIPQEYRSECV